MTGIAAQCLIQITPARRYGAPLRSRLDWPIRKGRDFEIGRGEGAGPASRANRQVARRPGRNLIWSNAARFGRDYQTGRRNPVSGAPRKMASTPMDAKLTVLVVAPDQAIRRSLSFALEAEGYRVDASPGLHSGALPPTGRETACAIVDEDALTDRKNPVPELSGLYLPVILLVEQRRHLPALPRLSIIEKPPLGRDLLDAVAAASGRLRSFP